MILPPRRIRRLVAAGLGLLWCAAAHADHYTLPLLLPSGTTGEPQGVLRILNGTDESGTVEIHAIDDAGTRSGPATFTLNASAAAEFSASDLVSGNAMKGLTGSIGTLSGDVRLEIDTDLQIIPTAYVRAADGTLSTMHDSVRASAASGGGYEYLVPIFNPSTEMTQESRLRLINPGDAQATVTVEAADDEGTAASGGRVELTLAGGAARTLTAQQLEAGDTGLTGRLGAGVGNWRLNVSSDEPIQVLNVVSSTSGYVNNLSTTAVAGSAPANHEAFNERIPSAGIELRTDTGDFTFTAGAGDRFTETGESDGMAVSSTGSYAYEVIGPDAGRLTLSYDDGDVCETNLYFSSSMDGWFASFCTGSDDPDGYWVGGNWSVADEDEGGDGGGDPVTTAYGVDEALPGVPASGFFVPAVLSGGSVSSTAAGTTINLNNGGYFELNDGTRYTCASGGGCAIANGTVTRGTVTGTAAGGGEVDRFPTFRNATAPGNRTYTAGTAIESLTLPEAGGGDGTLSYSLSPAVPGLTFDAATRRLTGTPSTAGSYSMTYTVADEDGDTDSLGFTITVSDGTTEAGSLGVCQVGMMLGSGQSCTYPGTEDAFSVNTRGRGSFLGRLAGIRIRIDNETIDGRVYDFEASHQGDGVWRIDRIAGTTEAPASGNGMGGTGDGNGGGQAAGPDLAVQSASASNVSPGPGDAFTLSATVRNRGAGQAAATTLRYYRSTDGTITSSDTELGTDALGALAASATSTQSIGLSAPSTAGTYFYGVCVDPVAGESDSGNNCSAAVSVTVSDSQMAIESFDLDPWQTFPTEIAFANDRIYVVEGDYKVYAYRATGERDSASDFNLDRAHDRPTGFAFANDRFHVVDGLDAKVYAYRATGERDSASDFDLDSANGHPSGIAYANDRFHVGDAGDDKVYAYRATGERNSASDFDLDSANESPTGIAYANDRFYVLDSRDDWVYAYDRSGQRAPGFDLYLEPGNESPTGIAVANGKVYLVDSSDDRVYVLNSTDPSPDLTISSASAHPPSPLTGQSFDIEARVRNRGTATSAATTLRYFRSTDSTISTSDTEIGTDAVGAISRRASSDATVVTLTAPETARTYYYGACVDSVSGELYTDNNCSSGIRVTVRARVPDLVVESPSVSDDTPTSEGTFVLSASVRNSGTAASAATTLRFYRSDNRSITTNDTQVGTAAVSALAVDGAGPHSITLPAPTEDGTHYYGACVDDVAEESNTRNNCSGAVPVFAGGPFPAYDLAIGSATLDYPTGIVYVGEGIYMSVTVINKGPNTSQPAKLRFGSTSFRDRDIPALDSGETTTFSRVLVGGVRRGRLTFRACIVEAPGEENNSNNCASRSTVRYL